MLNVKADIPRNLQLEIDDKEEVQDGQLQQMIDEEDLEKMKEVFEFDDNMIVEEESITENHFDSQHPHQKDSSRNKKRAKDQDEQIEG